MTFILVRLVLPVAPVAQQVPVQQQVQAGQVQPQQISGQVSWEGPQEQPIAEATPAPVIPSEQVAPTVAPAQQVEAQPPTDGGIGLPPAPPV